MIEVSKLGEVRKSFVTITRLQADLERKVMKILKHPDATGSQINEARQALLGVEEPMRRVVTALREKYPYPTISTLTRPWHRQEYDIYDEAIMGKTRAHDRTGEEDSRSLEKE
jgi:hypothetical protein